MTFYSAGVAQSINPARDFGFFHVRKIIQLAYGKSVVLLRCLLVPKMHVIHGGAPEVFHTNKSWKSHHIYVYTFTVFKHWLKIQQINKLNEKSYYSGILCVLIKNKLNITPLIEHCV